MLNEAWLLDLLESPAKPIILVYTIVFFLSSFAICLDCTNCCRYKIPTDEDAIKLGIKKDNDIVTELANTIPNKDSRKEV